MYLFVKALLKERSKNSTWKEVDISLLPLATIYTRFEDGHIELTNSSIGPGSFYVDLNELRQSNIAFQNLPFENWLGYIGNTPLPFLAGEPEYTVSSVLYCDAFQSRFKFTRANPAGENPWDTVGIDKKALTDAYVYKDNIDTDHLHNNALFTVNGLLHRTIPYDEGIIIKDASRSVDAAKRTSVGVLSFVNIGNIQQIPITDEMIGQTSPSIPIRQTVAIDTGIDLTGKTVLLSFGGYLHINDSLYDVLSYENGLIRINLERATLPRRIFEMRRRIDISSLGLSRHPSSPGALVVDEIRTDDFVRKFLKLSQTFLIIVDANNLYTEKHTLGKPAKLFGFYELKQEPLYPIQTSNGLLPEYWTRNIHGNWVMSVGDADRRRYLFETTHWDSLEVINESLVGEHKIFPSAHLLKISKCVRT